MSESTEHPEHTSFVPQKESTKLGFWVFLGGEVILFGTLIATYLLFRLHNPGEFNQVKQHLSIPLIAINTFILILSSFMVVRALESIRDGNVKGLRTNLLFVLLLGAMFLGGQAYEWTSLFREGIDITTVFGTPFFTVTGIHGSHVFVGLLWNLFLQQGIRKGAYSKKRYLGVEVFGLYWHFVDIVWIVLFTLFYLI
jgi:heme/copper-type cytochrome/quinol oxidase subunit 3